MRNNPKYFNIEKMAKAQRDEMISKVKDYLARVKEQL
jgi:hypothetical protein